MRHAFLGIHAHRRVEGSVQSCFSFAEDGESHVYVITETPSPSPLFWSLFIVRWGGWDNGPVHMEVHMSPWMATGTLQM